MDTSNSLPPDSPMDGGWTADASTNAQASRKGVMHMGYEDSGQIDMSMGDKTMGHSERTYPREYQTDTMGVEKSMDAGQSFRRTTLLYEKMSGGYTPNTAPVGEAMPAPMPTAGTRNAEDTEAIQRMRMGQV